MTTAPKSVIRFLIVAAPALLLGACVPSVDMPQGRIRDVLYKAPPAPPAQRSDPRRSARAAPLLPYQNGDLTPNQCRAKLVAQAVKFMPLANEDDGRGCALIDTVRLDNFGYMTANLGPMTCPLAANFVAWARYGVAPAARLYFGSELVRIETFGTYACRNIVGNPNMAGKRSEHAHANAVDVAAFILADGRRIALVDGWRDGGTSEQFLSAIHDSACKRFKTVLSPDYNKAHANHFHLDMGGKGGYCR